MIAENSVNTEFRCGRFTHKKAFTRRFGFDNVRISQVRTVRQKQSNGNAPWDVLYIQTPNLSPWHVGTARYVYICVGLSRCSFRRTGHCEGLYIAERAISKKAPRSFCVFAKSINVNACFEESEAHG